MITYVSSSTQVGHRAELWNVNEWIAEVSCEIIRRGDDHALIRLLDPASGELFAECPVPIDVPLTTAVEPVIDSSRYYVIRVVDGQTGRHAFIGVGFRDRENSSDFNAALHEYLAFVRRKREAEQMRKEYEIKQQQRQESVDAQDASQAAAGDTYSLPPGETLKLRINVPRDGGPGDGNGSGGFVSAHKGKLTKTFSLMFAPDGSSVAALAPPAGSLHKINVSGGSLNSGGPMPQLSPMGLSPSHKGEAACTSPFGQARQKSNSGGQDEDFGEFVG